MKWFGWSLGSMACLSAMLLVFKRMSLQGVSSAVILVFTLGVAFALNALMLAGRGELANLRWAQIPWLMAAGALSFVGNLLYLRSLAIAPNPGYPAAVEGAKAFVVLLLSVVLFGSRLTPSGVAGVLLCVLGIALLAR